MTKTAKQIGDELFLIGIKRALNIKNDLELKKYIDSTPFSKLKSTLENRGVSPVYRRKINEALSTVGLKFESKIKAGRPLNAESLLRSRAKIDAKLNQLKIK